MACAVVFCAWGCSSSPAAKRPMPMEGVAELPGPKGQPVVTYRCAVDLASGTVQVQPGTRSGREEVAKWNKLSPRLAQGDISYEVLIEENDKSSKGTTDWAMVTVVESQSSSGKVIRSIPVYEFWGTHDQKAVRALMITKDGHLQFFVQFWTAE